MSRSLSKTDKPPILFICNYYLPGFKAGGGLRTIVNTVERFNDQFDFYVIALDHDGDNIPYTSIKTEEWNNVQEAKVFYLTAKELKIAKVRELIQEVKPKLIYVNSVFSELTIYLLTLRKLNLIEKIPVIIAPEGELSDGALQLKATKKKFFMNFAKTSKLYQNLIWKVTAEPEKAESIKFKGNTKDIFIAPNLPSKSLFAEYNQQEKIQKNPGEAKMIFLSRYGRKKNFKWLLDNINNIKGNLVIDVYGPLEDIEYWNETIKVINNLPENIKVSYKGEVVYEQVLKVLYQYHFFILPTLGENFGHVFIEAMAAGCPLIISDTTPWRDLESKKVGWDISLEEPQKWVSKINDCIQMNQESYTRLSNNSREFAVKWLSDPEIEESTLTVLRHGLSKSL